jgi:hypothetical protein
MGRRDDAAIERRAEEAGMSKSERRFTHESIEGHQADEFVEEHLGGSNPERLVDEVEPPRG